MAQNKLAQRLYKEFVRNPKKSVVLALVSLVAFWFWVPLVWNWVVPATVETAESGNVAATVDTAVANIANIAETADKSKNQDRPQVSWQNFSQLFQHHQLMASGQLQDSTPSPFAGWAVPKEDAESKNTDNEEPAEVEQVAARDPRTPEELGLELTSTIIGRNIRLAVINGEACELNTVLVIPSGVEEVEFQVVSIDQDRVQLRSAGMDFELQRTPATSKMKVDGIAASSSNIDQHNGKRIVLDSLRGD